MASPEPLVLPVRFSIGTTAVQASSRALTYEGVFIRSLSPPQVGLRVGVRIYFPDSSAEEYACLVDHRAPPLGENGFWARFVSLTPQARERIRVVLSSAAAQPKAAPQTRGVLAAAPARSGADQRALPRFPIRLRTRVRTALGPRLEFSVNISASGMFIASETPPALREVVALSIDLPGEGAPLEANAEVMHLVRPAQANKDWPAGYGVQFIHADDRFRERLDRLLAGNR
jgi:uncharacterized protein (TIGR02266 family)